MFEFGFFESLFGFLIFIFDMVAIFDIITGPKDSFKKFVWVVAILIMPVLGLILYYLFGKENLMSRLKQHYNKSH
ncbi:MAG TPA: PLD nuclease N-terminal domain-containing protein [Candidatus Gastranaerophilales bacterium]|nr:PLD nuclease N-terminal domain-containing protein [Candidatus Gastranaerophilales bacterium]